MLKITPIGYQNKYTCYFCHSTKSVKYFVEVIDRLEGPYPVLVPCCNKCALYHKYDEEIVKGT